MFYIPVTVTAWKDDVVLFETDCEARIDYDITDGLPDWNVTEFHFSDKGAYTRIAPHEPLFYVLYNALNRDWLHEQVMEALINNGEISRYVAHDYA